MRGCVSFVMRTMTTKGVGLLLLCAVLLFPATCLGAEVVDAAICQNIQAKEPVGTATIFPQDIGKVWCWSRIKDGQETIKHIYYHNGEEKAVVELKVLSPDFRTYSSKLILPSQIGSWRVDIVDPSGNILKSLAFAVGENTATHKPAEIEEAATVEQSAPAKETTATEQPAETEEATPTQEQSQ